MKFTEEDYLNEDWFFGDEAEISCRTRKMVTTRKEHPCYLSECYGQSPHVIEKGSRVYYEKALIDRDFWGKFYMCTNCMDAQLAEYYDNEPPNTSIKDVVSQLDSGSCEWYE